MKRIVNRVLSLFLCLAVLGGFVNSASATPFSLSISCSGQLLVGHSVQLLFTLIWPTNEIYNPCVDITSPSGEKTRVFCYDMNLYYGNILNKGTSNESYHMIYSSTLYLSEVGQWHVQLNLASTYSVEKTYDVYGGIPTYTAPSYTVTYGTNLDSIKLPNSDWSWLGAPTGVVSVGTYTYYAKYAPPFYTAISSIPIKITISPYKVRFTVEAP